MKCALPTAAVFLLSATAGAQSPSLTPQEDFQRAAAKCSSCTKVLIRYVDQNGNHDGIISIHQQDLLWKEHLQGPPDSRQRLVLVRFLENADYVVSWQEQNGNPVVFSTGSGAASSNGGYATASGFGATSVLQRIYVQAVVSSKDGGGLFRVSHSSAWSSKPDAACLKQALDFIEKQKR